MIASAESIPAAACDESWSMKGPSSQAPSACPGGASPKLMGPVTTENAIAPALHLTAQLPAHLSD